ncbi:MAG: hypothetical protein PUB98_04585 [Clostridiales bacterium]|nr:hypothetical protein [Clostridiales bacterium]
MYCSRRKILGCFGGIITILVVVLTSVAFSNDIFLKIDASRVEEEEYWHMMDESRFEVTQYFLDEHNVALDELKDWENSYGKESPCKKLMETVLEKLIYRRAVYRLGMERGYVESVEYRDIVRRWHLENEQRETKKEKGEIVYGLTEFSLEQYISYEMQGLKQCFLEDKENTDLQITQDEREEHFRNNEWTGADGSSEAVLEEIKSIVDRDLQELRYEQRIEEYVRKTKIKLEEANWYDITFARIRKWYGK